MIDIAKYKPKIAYFSMEVGVADALPTYSGGLGILAGDFAKSCADLEIPLIVVACLYDHGYFTQRLENGRQTEVHQVYDPREYMHDLDTRTKVKIEGRNVFAKAWLRHYTGKTGFAVPILFLDTHLPENKDWDKHINANLYGGSDPYHRITQEIVLGIGGVRLLQELGFDPEVYHLNEGHGAFATIELARQLGSSEAAKERTVFTTHTPVPAGHDRFDYGLVRRVLQDEVPADIAQLAGQNELNTTLLALNMSRYANAVSRKHGEVSRKMFPSYAIDSITNGVHSYTWTSELFEDLYDAVIPEWRVDPANLINADRISDHDLLNAHYSRKQDLIEFVNSNGYSLNQDLLTIGFARRFATYKRGDLIFSDMQMLSEICNGKVQFVFAGKAHPRDEPGKEVLSQIRRAQGYLKGKVEVAFIPDYTMSTGKLLTSGCDVWLNTPLRGNEASGTSGMKAAHNAVPHFSTPDGWWLEAKSGGWTIGRECSDAESCERQNQYDAGDFYKMLRDEVIPAFQNPEAYAEIQRQAIMNSAYFNMERTVREYVEKAYELGR